MKSKINFLQYFLFLALLFALLTTSCVTNKKYQYLQKDDVNVKTEDFPKDTVLRSYALDTFVYRLQPEDVLSVEFYSLTPEEFDFSKVKKGLGSSNQGGTGSGSLVAGYLIDENGYIEFPVLGKVKVSGLTIFEVQNKLQDLANNLLEVPVVEVRLLNFRFTVLGEVDLEGVFFNSNPRISVLEAVGLSGGFSDLADKSNVKIIRQNGSDIDVYYINLLDENFLSSPQFYVNQLDVIVVPPLKQRPYQVYFGKNISLFVTSLSLLLIVIGLISN